MTDFNLIELFGESFFTRNDTLIATQAPRHSFGVAGEPVPYTIRGDDMMTILLMACFVLFVISLARSWRFIKRQLKDFFYISHNGNDEAMLMGGELHFLLFLFLVDCLVLGMAAYLFAKTAVDGDFVAIEDYLIIGLFFALFAVYFLLKALTSTVVNVTFFGGNKNLQWQVSQLFLVAGEGVMMYPLVLLQAYFGLSTENGIYGFFFVLIVTKILTFYKSWLIFFRQKGLFLQNFLYFCALEIVPLLALWGVLWVTIDLLKVNY